MGTKDLCCSNLIPLLLLQLTFFFLTLLSSHAEALDQEKLNSSIPAIFVFGDSTVDPGNNNYLSTPIKSNFPPYGQDFSDRRPTGRFSNGKLPTDFIASFLGIKDEVPPYLDKTLSEEELLTGVSFASAGTGYDPLTAEISLVLQMSKQLDYFKQYVNWVQGIMGKNKATELLQKSLFVCSCGTNDFVIDYFIIPIRKKNYNIEQYQNFILQQFQDFIRGLYELGARRIAVVGLPPLGCIPAVITINSQNMASDRGCIASYNSIASDYNKKLQGALSAMQMSIHKTGGQILYADIYWPLHDMIFFPAKYGFEESMTGCCGTGLIEAAFLCNDHSRVCPDASRYIFWDSVHPTEKAYHVIAEFLYETLKSFI